jgi:plasmid maintenance system antidote protein VapI
MYWAGEFQNRIAAAFDCNPARISEIIHGKRHPGSEQVARDLLS